MSASTIARWNAIPLSHDDETSLKRPRPDQDGDDDDNMTIASRSPSPGQIDAMDVDSLVKYDEYVRGTPREVITVETKIKSTNKGFTMLAKLGWSEGQPLGLSGDGRVDPIPFQIKRDMTGLGKTSQDVRMIETTVSQRRGLDSERQRKETELQRRAREDLVARKTALETEISTTLKAFYCTLCDKQFKTVAQYDEHTNSYAHHHKARFKDMQANARLKPKDEADKRKEKERKREEKELRKIAAASGIKMAKSTVAPSVSLDPISNASMEVDSTLQPPRKSGWASISSTIAEPAVPSPQPSSGLASVGSASAPAQPANTSGWAAVASGPSARLTDHYAATPTFRTGGWTSLDTGSSQTVPPPPGLYAPPPPPPPTDFPAPPPPSQGAWSTISSNGIQSPSTDGWSVSGPPPSSISTPPPPTSQLPTSAPTLIPAQPARTGWQQFQKSGSRRK